MAVGDIGIWVGDANVIPGTSYSKMTFGGTEDRNDNSTFTRTGANQDFQVNEDGAYLIIAVVHHNDGSNGRANYQSKITYSGSGDFATVFGSGYVRNTANDDATTICYGFCRNATSGDTFSMEHLRDTDTPTLGTVATGTHFTIIRWEDPGAVGLYRNNADSGAYSGTTWQDLTFDTTISETNTASIEKSGTTDFLLKGSNKRYLILGGAAFQNLSSNRTQRIIRAVDGTTEINGAMGYAYMRNSTNQYGAPNAGFIVERTASNITLSLQCQRGNAENDGTVSRVAGNAGFIIVELSDSVDVWASYDSTGNQALNGVGPTDVNATRTTSFNDSASFTSGGDNVTFDLAQNADVFAFANIGADAGTTASGTRLTRKFRFDIGGTDQARGACIGYLRNDQSTTGTRSCSWQPAGIYAATSGQSVKVEFVNDSSWDNGTADDVTFAPRVGLFGINTDTLDSGGSTPEIIPVDLASLNLGPQDPFDAINELRVRYAHLGLSTGSNDGTSEANAWQSLSDIRDNYQAGDHVYIKSDPGYILEATPITFNTTVTATSPVVFEGYTTTPGDGNLCEIDLSTLASGRIELYGIYMTNFDFYGDNSNPSVLVRGYNQTELNNLRIRALSTGSGRALDLIEGGAATNCYLEYSGTGTGTRVYRSNMANCVLIHNNNTGTAIEADGNYRVNALNNLLIYHSSPGTATTSKGLEIIGASTATPQYFNNFTINGFPTGVEVGSLPAITSARPGINLNNFVISNCTTGIDNLDGTASGYYAALHLTQFGFYNNTTDFNGSSVNWPIFYQVDCSVDPFTDASTFDFSLNNTTNGGAELAGKRIFGAKTTTTNLSYGVIQLPKV